MLEFSIVFSETWPVTLSDFSKFLNLLVPYFECFLNSRVHTIFPFYSSLWMTWLGKEDNWNIVICITLSSYFLKVIPFPWESWCFYPSKKVLTHMPQRVTLHCALHRYVAFVITRVGIFTEFLNASSDSFSEKMMLWIKKE